MELRIDPEFESLIQPLTAEERRQLEANLMAEGCRDPLSVWPVADGPPILLDGHNRYGICSAHNLPFDLVAIALDSREQAINWIIDHQLGRRNLTSEQKSYLRGKRYNLEKHAEGRPEKRGENPHVSGRTAERLARDYQVDEKTIREDGQFAAAVDTLKEVREDLPRAVMTKQSRRATKGQGQRKVTKARVITVGKLINEQKVSPLPCMRRGGRGACAGAGGRWSPRPRRRGAGCRRTPGRGHHTGGMRMRSTIREGEQVGPRPQRPGWRRQAWLRWVWAPWWWRESRRIAAGRWWQLRRCRPWES
jgi:hypothetical protein